MELTLIGLALTAIGAGTGPYCQSHLTWSEVVASSALTTAGVAISAFGIISILQ